MITIKTITRQWTPLLLAIDSPGPEVEFNPDEVTSVEYCCNQSLQEKDRTYYLYRKDCLSTLTVSNGELARFPDLLNKGIISYRNKMSSPDPLCGSCT